HISQACVLIYWFPSYNAFHISKACVECTVHALSFQSLLLRACHVHHNTTSMWPATFLSSVL
ncbi:hypothetical protein L195_g012142, partial [Trifolium pratense]